MRKFFRQVGKNEQKVVRNLQKRALFGAEIGKKRRFLSTFFSPPCANARASGASI